MLVEASYAAEVKASADDWKNSVNVTCVRLDMITNKGGGFTNTLQRTPANLNSRSKSLVRVGCQR